MWVLIAQPRCESVPVIPVTPLTSGSNLFFRGLSRALSFVGFLGETVQSSKVSASRPVERVGQRDGLERYIALSVSMVARGARSRRYTPCSAVSSKFAHELRCHGACRSERGFLVRAGTRYCFRSEAGCRVRDPVRTQSTEAVTRCMVKPSESRFGRQWYPLRIHVPEAGAARVEFTTRPAQGGTDDDCALWGNPRIEVPRPFSDFAAPLRSALAAGSLRGMWQRVLPANPERLYRLWVRENEPSAKELRRAARALRGEDARLYPDHARR